MASKLKLFESDDNDSDPEDCKLTINKEYAAKYEAWKEKEELQKLKEKYGDLSDYSSSSDEEEVAWNAEFDKEWLRVYSAVKFKDKDIYNKEVKFVRDEEDEDAEEESSDSGSDSSASEESEKKADFKKKKKKDDGPLTIKDHERRIITDRNGMLSESEEDEEVKAQALGPSYHEEQEAIRKSFKKAVADTSSDDDEGDILTRRVKSQKEKTEDNEEYLQFLKGEKVADDVKSRDREIVKDLAPLRTFFLEGDDDDAEAKKVVWDTLICRGPLKEKTDDVEEDDIEEETELKLMEDDEEEFEHAYNFRFEEPDKNFIKQYKRKTEDSVRQEVNKRAQKRKEVQQRKKTALEERREEIRRLKKLKRKELENRLQLLMKECPTGVNFNPNDLTGDFNPKLYDKMMQEKFDKMDEVDEDEEKPDMADLEDVLSLDSYEDIFEEGQKSTADDTLGTLGEEDEEEEEEEEEEQGTSGRDGSQRKQDDSSKVSVDAGYDPSWLPDMSRSTKKSRRRRKSKFQQALDAEKPLFSEVFEKYKDRQTPWEDYVQEYYNLDYKEHGFQYRKVVPNDFGMHPGEILWLPTRELNAWVSMKKVVEPKSESEELYEKRKYQSVKMQNKILKVMPSLKKIETEESRYEDIRPSVLREQKAQQAATDDSDRSGSEAEEGPAEEDLGSRLHRNSQESQMKKKKKQKTGHGESAETNSPPSLVKKKKGKTSLDESVDMDPQMCPMKKKQKSGLDEAADSEPQMSSTKKKKRKVGGDESVEHDFPPQKKKKLKAGGSQLLDNNQETHVTDELDSQGSEEKQKKKKKKKSSFGAEKGDESYLSQPESKEHKLTDNSPEVYTEEKKKKKLSSESKEAWMKGKKEKVADSSETLGRHETSKKKKKEASNTEGQSQTSKKSGKKKFKGKKKQKGHDGTPKVKGFIAKEGIQESRLAAFNIDPRKFKYTKDRIVPLQAE